MAKQIHQAELSEDLREEEKEEEGEDKESDFDPRKAGKNQPILDEVVDALEEGDEEDDEMEGFHDEDEDGFSFRSTEEEY